VRNTGNFPGYLPLPSLTVREEGSEILASSIGVTFFVINEAPDSDGMVKIDISQPGVAPI
jgi:hypothetical protein